MNTMKNIVFRVEKLWRSGVIDVKKTKELINAYCQFIDIEPELVKLEESWNQRAAEIKSPKSGGD